MSLTTFTSWRAILGLGNTQPRRRLVKAKGNWGIATEHLESRALLSATGSAMIDPPVAAEVAFADPRASFSYPNVAGTWSISGNGVEGTATLSQTKNKVEADLTFSGMPIHLKGKFTKAHPTELFASTRVASPLGGGKLKVDVHIAFVNGTDPNNQLPQPQALTGDVSVAKLGVNIGVTGNRLSAATSSLSEARSTKAAPMYPDLTGAWNFTATVPTIGEFQGMLQISQKKGKITADATLNDGVSLTLKGKISRNELTHITGRATVATPLPGFSKVKATFELDLSNNNSHFEGSANSKIGQIGLSGDRAV